MLLSKKCIGPVVATILLLLIGVISVVGFQNWFQTFSTETLANVERQDINAIDPVHIEPTTLYVSNKAGKNLTYTDVEVAGNLCNVSGTLQDGLNSIDLGACVSGVSVGPVIVTIYGLNNVFEETLILRSSATISGNLSVSFTTGACGIGYTKIYGLESMSDSHAEVAGASNYTYNVCVSHNIYTLGTSCTGERLFYLDGFIVMHMHILLILLLMKVIGMKFV